ncbi:DUF1490 family protein [Mycobacterium sp.]|uniref:DUF1490 family protein n=1 Tax=Mycobacterium sp. TaxID=1785 RepID=UPI000CA7F8C8|nr:DUF1490 family protein [Mycobacterium sp.]PJE01919.1 MAG: hypothetical protein CK428_30525 [Mycobacterium sp.]
MALHGLAAKAVPTVAKGVVGVVAYQALLKVPWRKLTVGTTALGIRAARTTERKTKAGTERARLAVADVLAEAAGRAGERVRAPSVVKPVPTITHEVDDACH